MRYITLSVAAGEGSHPVKEEIRHKEKWRHMSFFPLHTHRQFSAFALASSEIATVTTLTALAQEPILWYRCRSNISTVSLGNINETLYAKKGHQSIGFQVNVATLGDQLQSDPVDSCWILKWVHFTTEIHWTMVNVITNPESYSISKYRCLDRGEKCAVTAL